MPVRYKTINNKSSCTPWMTPDLKYCINKKYRLLRLLRRGVIGRDRFREYRNILNITIKQAKELYFYKKFMQNNGNMKKTWSLINDLMSRGKVKKNLQINDDNGAKLDDKQMSDYVNDYFSNVTARLGVTNISPNNSFLRFLNPVVNSIFMLPSSDFEISNIINSLPLKNTSFDDIPVKILRLISVPLSCWLSAIYNHCLNLGFYPSLLKTARVIPIFKGGNSANVSNYRPISNLLTINKIFEKLTFNRINNFFESGKIISENQHGFRKGRNTTTAILQLINNLLNGFHNKKYTVCIFLDLRKAFDCVNHSVLLNKLFTYGVRGGAYKLVESYLSNRSQYSEVNNNVSTIKTIKTGVPQGSILGPLLFNAFINDIVSLKDVEVALYADDAVFYMNDESLTELILRLNKFLDSLSEWLKLNLLVPNTEKTVLMLFTPFATPTLPDVIFMGKN